MWSREGAKDHMKKMVLYTLLALLLLGVVYLLTVRSILHEAPDRAKALKTKHELKEVEVVGREWATRIYLEGTRDTFDKDNPYKILILDGGEILAYSYGPDRDDDRCSVAYSPSNGTQSNGDIYREIVLSAT